MSMEQAMLARARPQVMANKIHAALAMELSKGCRRELCPQPVDLEPPYLPIGTADVDDMPWILQPAVPRNQLLRLAVWLSPEQNCEWRRSELFLKQLCGIYYRAALELVGNCAGIGLRLLCHCQDEGVVHAAFASQFEQCRLSRLIKDPLQILPASAWQQADWLDFLPPPPYSHLLTQPNELQHSPLTGVFAALAQIPPPALGVYQILFAPVDPDHNWYANVQTAIDLEYASKLINPTASLLRAAQQTPSGDLRQMSMELGTKAHNDKPFFAVAFRLAVVGAGGQASGLLRALSLVSHLTQHGGRPLLHLDQRDYRQAMAAPDPRGMILDGIVHRPGFILNSWELTTLVHMVPPGLNEHRKAGLHLLEPLRPADDSDMKGMPLGVCDCGDKVQTVCLDPNLRFKHIDLIGRPGQGKSTLMERMILYDISQGHGVAVLDPHGRLVRRMLDLIPPEHADRVIYLDPGNEAYVPLWNPLRRTSTGEGVVSGPWCEQTADNLVGAFRSFVDGWGDRLEHVLRHAFNAVLHLPGGTLLDVANLLRRKSKESNLLRSQILRVIDNLVARQFWQEDFNHYSNKDLSPAAHKTSKLLMSGTAGLMLSQPDSAFDFTQVADQGMIMLWDLSHLGSETREILGSFVLSLLHQTALGRDGTIGNLPCFHIYCDEAHRLITDALEDVLAETRKFKVSLTLAHQTMEQMGIKRQQALSNVGTTIIFNVDRINAIYLQKDLQDRVELNDLLTLDEGEAIARINSQIIRIRTAEPLLPRDDSAREAILARCRERYCRPAEQIHQQLRRQDNRQTIETVAPIVLDNNEKAFAYDEL